jgi:arylformamidase
MPMKIYDITVPISDPMPVWPGDPGVELSQVSQIEAGEDSNVSRLSMGVHTGTHVDAPLHFLPNGFSLDEVPIDYFIGQVQVVDLSEASIITAQDLLQVDLEIGISRILFKTHNSTFWARGERCFQEDFVALSPDAAHFLVDRGYRLVGIDYLSIAPYRESRPTHEILLGANIIILEGINLTSVPPGIFTLYCLPLKLEKVEGAPVRAILTRE